MQRDPHSSRSAGHTTAIAARPRKSHVAQLNNIVSTTLHLMRWREGPLPPPSAPPCRAPLTSGCIGDAIHGPFHFGFVFCIAQHQGSLAVCQPPAAQRGERATLEASTRQEGSRSWEKLEPPNEHAYKLKAASSPGVCQASQSHLPAALDPLFKTQVPLPNEGSLITHYILLKTKRGVAGGKVDFLPCIHHSLLHLPKQRPLCILHRCMSKMLLLNATIPQKPPPTYLGTLIFM